MAGRRKFRKRSWKMKSISQAGGKGSGGG